MASLNRSRPYGQIYPATDGAAFEQEHMLFDSQGRFLRLSSSHPDAGKKAAKPSSHPPATPPAAEGQSEGSGEGSGGGDDEVAIADLSWTELRRVAAKLGGPAGVGIKKADVMAFFAEQGTTHVAKAAVADPE